MQTYTMFFGALSGFKLFTGRNWNSYVNDKYEESTLSSAMRIQIYSIFFLWHLYQQMSDTASFVFGASLYYDYYEFVQIYRHEINQPDNIVQFIALSVFMTVGVSMLICIQWLIVPIMSDLVLILLVCYRLPSILKSHLNNSTPNLRIPLIAQDGIIITLIYYFRIMDNVTHLISDQYTSQISIALVAAFTTVHLYQYFINPVLITDRRSLNIHILYSPQTNVCAICLEENGQLVITDCQHVFHRQCLLAWYQVKNLCPICRQSLNP